MRRLGFLLSAFLFCLPVLAKNLTKVELTTASAQGYHITGGSGTLQLSSRCTYDDASVEAPCSTVTLTWGSSDPSATVNASGLVSSIASPTNNFFDIYAYSGTVLGHHPINLLTATPSALVSRPEGAGRTIVTGTTVLLSALDNTNNQPIGDYCAWSSSNTSLATVDTRGRVFGVAAGSPSITCNYFGLSVSSTVTVNSPTLSSNTWYVRPDGGTRWDAAVSSGQCTGLVNAAYVSGTDQPCAFNNPMYLWTDESSGVTDTSALGPGDTAFIAVATVNSGSWNPNGGIWNMGKKSPSVSWIMPHAGTIVPNSGTPAQHTRIIGVNWSPSTPQSKDSVGNRAALQAYYSSIIFDLRDVQNVDFDGIDLGESEDCQQHAVTGVFDFLCSASGGEFAFMADSFTANVILNDTRTHGFFANWTGTTGPNFQMTNSSEQYAVITGYNFDNPFGFNGNRTDGFTAIGSAFKFGGCTEELPKPVTSVSRTGGVTTVTFAAGAVVNYEAGTNIVLQGMTPSDLNGTFPVASISFNQQTVNITGGSCPISSQPGAQGCTFTTSSAPAFTTGSFIQITGASPSFLNGFFELFSVSGSGFTVWATNQVAGWPISSLVTISSGGTASTASSLTFTQAGSNENASVVGTAWHVYHNHRCYDQNDGAFSNGDNVGTGNNTIGRWICDHCEFRDGWEDGWDMLHSAMDYSQFTNSISTGSEGAPAKFGNTDVGLFDNNYLVANCAAHLAFNANFPADYNQYTSTVCRAADAYPSGERAWSSMVITNNSWDTTHATFFDDSCNDAMGCNVLTSFLKDEFQNNVIIGFFDTNNNLQGTTLPGFGNCASSTTCPVWTYTKNSVYNVRNPPMSQYSFVPGVKTIIPNISTFAGETGALTFDLSLTGSGSNLVAAGIHNADVPSTDINGVTRPNPPSVGAFDVPAAPPSPPTAPAPQMMVMQVNQ
jgi:hypothetical protein